jgi:hypothetical protein
VQIIYAAPFLLLSLFSFAVCLSLPRLRPFALHALVVPVSFGVFSIISWVAFALTGYYLKMGPASGTKLVLAGVLFYLLPGLLGAWLSVAIVKFGERKLLKTDSARLMVFRVVISMIAAFVGGVLGMGFVGSWLGEGYVVATLELSALIAVICGVLAFILSLAIENRRRRNSPSTLINSSQERPT